MTLPLAAETTGSSIALIVALIGAAVGLVSAWFAHRASGRAAAIAANAEASNRFGPWQVAKRERYTELLENAAALRDASEAESPQALQVFRLQIDQLMLYANKELRPVLLEYHNAPENLSDSEKWRGLVDALRADVLQIKSAD